MQKKILVFLLFLIFNFIYCEDLTTPEETTTESQATLQCEKKCREKEICLKCNKCPDDSYASYLLAPLNQSMISCQPGPIECCVCKGNRRRRSDGKCAKIKKCKKLVTK